MLFLKSNIQAHVVSSEHRIHVGVHSSTCGLPADLRRHAPVFEKVECVLRISVNAEGANVPSIGY